MKRYHLTRIVVLVLLLVASVAVVQAATTLTLDFEGLTPGTNPGTINLGDVSVSVVGDNPDLPAGTDAAVVFDSDAPPGGDDVVSDDDLKVGKGNVLIISVDGSAQNDAVGGGVLTFTFTKPVVVSSLVVIDTEEGGDVLLYNSGSEVHSQALPLLGNGDYTTVPVPYGGEIDMMDVKFNGSGATDDIIFTVPDDGGEGCTPGFWKNTRRPGVVNAWNDAGYTPPGPEYNAVFSVGPEITLLEALNTGGGGESALLRHSTAAVLNASSSADYAYSATEVITLVQGAYDSGDFEQVKNMFEAENESGCPFNASGR